MSKAGYVETYWIDYEENTFTRPQKDRITRCFLSYVDKDTGAEDRLGMIIHYPARLSFSGKSHYGTSSHAPEDTEHPFKPVALHKTRFGAYWKLMGLRKRTDRLEQALELAQKYNERYSLQ